jgi:hypothetical protein
VSLPADLKANRRQFLAAGGMAALAVGGAEQLVFAGPVAAARSASVVLHDPRLRMPADVAQRLAANGARIIQLDQDPVVLWRTELHDLVARENARLFGLTRWPDYLIMRGLAAELRRHPRYENQHPETGNFTWLIA